MEMLSFQLLGIVLNISAYATFKSVFLPTPDPGDRLHVELDVGKVSSLLKTFIKQGNFTCRASMTSQGTLVPVY